MRLNDIFKCRRVPYMLLFFNVQPDSVVEAAVEKINNLLESFMGINDADLGNSISLLGQTMKVVIMSLLFFTN